jgi:hypothetical protein
MRGSHRAMEVHDDHSISLEQGAHAHGADLRWQSADTHLVRRADRIERQEFNQ